MIIFMEKGLKVMEIAVLWAISCTSCLTFMYS